MPHKTDSRNFYLILSPRQKIMEQIIDFSRGRLHNKEHYQFMSDFSKMITATTPETLGVVNQFPAFTTVLSKEGVAIGVEDGSSLSKKVSLLDIRRDNTWSAINFRIKSTLTSPIDEEVESAVLLERLMNQHGNVRELPYNEETAAVQSLVKDLQGETYAPHVAQTGLTGWVEALKTQNEEFVTTFDLRNSEMAGRPNGNVKSVRQQLDPLYDKIVDRINAAITLEIAADGVETFVSELNEKIRYYQNTLAIRNGRNQNDETADE